VARRREMESSRPAQITITTQDQNTHEDPLSRSDGPSGTQSAGPHGKSARPEPAARSVRF
jgi:hypothetical protein